jgi:hypothetical protein
MRVPKRIRSGSFLAVAVALWCQNAAWAQSTDGGVTCTQPPSPPSAIKDSLNFTKSINLPTPGPRPFVSMNVSVDLAKDNTGTDSGNPCDVAWGVKGTGAISFRIANNVEGWYLKGGGQLRHQEYPVCTTPPKYTCQGPTCEYLHGNISGGPSKGLYFNLCHYAPVLCKLGSNLWATLMLSGGVTAAGSHSAGPACCNYTGRYTWSGSVGGQLGGMGSVSGGVKLFGHKLSLAGRMLVCVSPSAGLGSNCSGQLYDNSSLKYRAQACLDTVSGLGVSTEVKGNQLEIKIDQDWWPFTMGFSIPKCLLDMGNADIYGACPGGMGPWIP